MTPNDDEAYLAVQNARQALRENRRSDARKWAEHAARLAPQMEDPWLILAAIASPQASLEFIQRALKINPESVREQPSTKAETKESPVERLPAAALQPAATPVPPERIALMWRGRSLLPI